jgi:hypothetical protein
MIKYYRDVGVMCRVVACMVRIMLAMIVEANQINALHPQL